MKRFRLTVLGTVAFVTIAAASGCTSTEGNSGAARSTKVTPTGSPTVKASPTASPTASAMVKTASAGDLGTILVDAKGHSLYLFEADTSTTSTCKGACATAWPPLLTAGAPTAGGSAKSKLLGTSKRSDGAMQVTYHGHPLYRYAGDSKPGDTNGQALNQFGAEWYVVDADGNKVDKS
jgi:predicted lipoprotein with Yx(FWY)xxD motif